MEVIAFLGIGSNIEPREQYIVKSLESLQKSGQVRVLRVSSYYRTKPFGIKDQGEFLNIVLEIETRLSALDLLVLIKQVEKETGRQKRIRWGEREIDIDILLYGDKIVSSKDLEIPHPGLMERDFFIIPLLELSPEITEPRNNKKLSEIIFPKENRYIIGMLNRKPENAV